MGDASAGERDALWLTAAMRSAVFSRGPDLTSGWTICSFEFTKPPSFPRLRPLQDVLVAIAERLNGLQRELGAERAARLALQERVDFVVKQTADGQKALTDECLLKFEQKLVEFSAAADAASASSKQVGGQGAQLRWLFVSNTY